jgi:tetratricopeptide (TPR) repeat protein
MWYIDDSSCTGIIWMRVSAVDWQNKGNALCYQDKYDEAIKCYDEALRLDPNIAAAWNNKANALHHQGKYEEAIKAYDEVIRIDPNIAGAWYNKANALDALGKTTEANAAFAKAKEMGYKDES